MANLRQNFARSALLVASVVLLLAGLGGLDAAQAQTSSAIRVNPTSITFRYTQGETLPPSQSVTATVPLSGRWSTFDLSPFYDATPACAFGTCPSGSSTTLTSSPQLTGLAVGTHEAALTVSADGFPDVVIPVTLIVSAAASPALPPSLPPPPPPGSITTNPSSVTFMYTSGMALPAPQAVTVTVPGGERWSTFDASPFYDASPGCAFGTCSSGSSTILTPSSGMPGLPVGTHLSVLTLRASGVADVLVPVTVIVSPPSGAALYVSPTGSDSNPGTLTQPFLTIEKARDVVRTMNSSMTRDIAVVLRGGEYRLPATLALGSLDSGTNGFSVIYQAYPGERPILTGGRKITGWTPVGNDVYRAPAGGLRFRQLYVNGSRAVRARTPNDGSYETLLGWDEGGQRIRIRSSLIRQWSRLNQVEMVILGAGVNQANLRVSSFTTSGSDALVVPREPERARLFAQDYPTKTIRPFYFENAFEFLDAPGEWYLNTQTNEVFYKLRPNETISTLDVVAPVLEKIVALQGTLGQPVHHIQFHGLTFQDSTWLIPDSEGYIGDQASIVYTQVLPEDEVASYPGHRLPAGFHLEAADHIRLERNTFQNMGASALNLYVAASDNVIIGNVITDVSGSGISVDLNLEGNPADPRKVSRRNVITNNYIARTGRDYYQTVGIMVGYGDSTVIEHNELVDMPFSGISVGWGWADRDNAARNNVVRYNEVSRVLQLMDDGGGIYTLSRQPGTVVAENYIHDLVRPPTPIAGIYGFGAIFLDNGSNLITVRDNVILDVGDDVELIRINDNGPSNSLINNAGSSSATIANAGLQPAYQDIRPSSP